MQWFKSAMVVSTVLVGVGSLTVNCTSKNPTTDGGTDGGGDVLGMDVKKMDGSGGNDSGKDGGTCNGPPCELCDVSGYTPSQMGSPIQMLNACTASQITAYVAACFAPGTSTTCNAWYAQDAGACTKCLTPTPETQTTWGAISCVDSMHCGVNQAGCVDLILNGVALEKGKGGAGSCGDLVNALFGCQSYDCNTCVDPDFTTCENNANTKECKPYFDPEQSTTGACASLQGDSAPSTISDCFPSTTAGLSNTLNVYCGTGQ
jgi:hypothetical protein